MRLMLDLQYVHEIITSVNFNEKLREQLKDNVRVHKQIVTDLNSDFSVDSYLKIYHIDYMFHELYLKCSGNTKIVDLFQYINPFLYSNYLFQRQSREKDIAGVKEHEIILNAILSEDEQALRDALHLHIDNAKQAVSLILKVDKML
nr:FCD domain-containing protein [Alkalibaculum sporogenes]